MPQHSSPAGPPNPRRPFHFPWRTARSIRADVDEELGFHLDMRAAELERAGLPPQDALREAMRQFGDLDDARSYCRTIDARTERAYRRGELMSDLGQDIQYALRRLRRAPGFAAVATLTLALGIGATTAIFSVVNAVLLRPLPFAEPERLVAVAPLAGGTVDAMSVPDFVDLRARTRTLQAASLVRQHGFSVTAVGAEPDRVFGASVSANFFSLLRLTPVRGRFMRAEEDGPGAAPVVVLSYPFWRARFEGDPNVVGKTITLDGVTRTIIGVAPRGSEYPLNAQFWTPFVLDQETTAPGERGNHSYEVIGRLADGTTLEAASREMGAIMSEIAREHPAMDKGYTGSAIPLRTWVVGDMQKPLLVLLGAVGLVLLIACANVANLFLLRAASRESEMAIRTALGAGRTRLARQLVTESVVLCTVGGLAGLAVAMWGTRALIAFAPSIPRLRELHIDAPTLLLTAALTLITGLIFGLMPVLHAAPGELSHTLRAGTRGSRTRQGSGRLRDAIVIAQVALAATLLVCAGLLLRSFDRLMHVDPGVRTERVLSFRLQLPSARYATNESERQFVRALADRLAQVPGVQASGIGTGIPLTGANMLLTVWEPGGLLTKEQHQDTEISAITPGYLQALAIPVLRGRPFTGADRFGSSRVVLISKEFARRYFPTEDPIGKVLDIGWQDDEGQRGGEIVGIVGDVKQNGPSQPDSPMLYLPYDQSPTEALSVMVHASGPPAAIIRSLRAAVHEVDPAMPVVSIRTMEEVVSASVANERFYALLLGIFASLALVLASVGLYGVIAYAVSQRTAELGIRIALGAESGRITRMVVRQGMLLVLGGEVLGVLGAFVLARAMRGLLFGVRTTDPLTFVAVAALLLLVALLASWVPARRAARVDPLIAMRAE